MIEANSYANRILHLLNYKQNRPVIAMFFSQKQASALRGMVMTFNPSIPCQFLRHLSPNNLFAKKGVPYSRRFVTRDLPRALSAGVADLTAALTGT